MNFRIRPLAIALAISAVAGLTACSDSNADSVTSPSPDNDSSTSQSAIDSSDNYPTPILTSKLDVRVWNDIIDNMWNTTGLLDHETHYTDNDYWNVFREYANQNDTSFADMSDYELWETYRGSYIEASAFSADITASNICRNINDYIESSGGYGFNGNQLYEFNLICTNSNVISHEFPNIASMLNESYVYPQGNSTCKVYVQNKECVAVVYISGRTEEIESGVDCPYFNELSSAFDSFSSDGWNTAYGEQVNSSFEIVGLYPN